MAWSKGVKVKLALLFGNSSSVCVCMCVWCVYMCVCLKAEGESRWEFLVEMRLMDAPGFHLFPVACSFVTVDHWERAAGCSSLLNPPL